MRSTYFLALLLILGGCKQAVDNKAETENANRNNAPSIENINEYAWVLKNEIDPITDKNTKEAFILSKDNNKLTLLRRGNNSVWAYVQLAGSEQFGVDEELIFRVDKEEPVEFNDNIQKISAKYGDAIHSWEWNPNLIGFLMWHGKADEGCGYIRQLFNGKELVVRYHPNQSTQKDIFFSIDKNKDAILNAIDLDISSCGKSS